MYYKWLILAVLSVVSTNSAYAEKGTFYLAGLLGRNSLDVDAAYQINNDARQISANYGILAGYKFDRHLIAEMAITANADMSLLGGLDSYDYYERSLSIGYNFKVFSWLQARPKLGVIDWHFKGEEGTLFNPGPEQKTKLNGTDLIWAIDFIAPISKRMQLSLSYKKAQLEFGDAESVLFGLGSTF